MSESDGRFVHLHLHTEYSALDAVLRVKDAVQKAKDDGAPALAITDHGGMFGAVDFSIHASACGIKPIIGMEANICDDMMHKQGGRGKGYYKIVLLAINDTGYKNLCILSNRGYRDGYFYVPRIDFGLLKEHSEGIVCLSGNIRGLAGRMLLERGEVFLTERLMELRDMFGDRLYLELQRNIMSSDSWDEETDVIQMAQEKTQAKQQEEINNCFMRQSVDLSIGLVATNDIHYANPDDWRVHELLLNIRTGTKVYDVTPGGDKSLNPRRETPYSRELYYRSSSSMHGLFKDCPEAVKNTSLIADMCSFAFDLKQNFYPAFEVPENFNIEYKGLQRNESYLRYLCEEAIPIRYTDNIKAKIAANHQDEDIDLLIKARVDLELGELFSKNFTDYILMVGDFVSWAKTQHIPVGPARGSGGGSVVLFLLGTIDTEPIHLGLFFERFINPERPSFPDIDVDICVRRRSEVIKYIVNKYSPDNVAHICTYGHMKAKMALRDVGRMLGINMKIVNGLTGDVPKYFDLRMSLETQEFQKKYNADPSATMLVDYALMLEGNIRNMGVHAAGIIVSSVPLESSMPLMISKEADMAVTQYAMKFIDKIGFLKIDVLGLKTLTIIDDAEKIILEQGLPIPDILNAVDDKKTYALLRKGATLTIFQLESGGMKKLLHDLRIDKFEELIATLALYRPGPMSMIPTYVNRKLGKEKIDCYFPELEPLLQETYGIIMYQEQVMKIAQIIAGYTLGEGDVLRRAMGKKDAEAMEAQRAIFCNRAQERGFDHEKVAQLFDIISVFAGYGFNKSHATGYAYIAYKTAFLKAHYPAVWLSCVMNLDFHDFEKIREIVHEARKEEIKVKSPDVNLSGNGFVAHEDTIIFPIHAIKSVGEQHSAHIVSERNEYGLFLSVEDFVYRMISRGMPVKVMVCIAKVGGLDGFAGTRASKVRFIEDNYDSIVYRYKEQSKGVIDIFDNAEDRKISYRPDITVKERSYGYLEDLYAECEFLGIALSGHPVSVAENRYGVNAINISTFLQDDTTNERVVLFFIEAVKTKMVNEKKMWQLQASDQSCISEIVIWSADIEGLRDAPATGLFYGRLRKRRVDNDIIRINCKKLIKYEHMGNQGYDYLYSTYETTGKEHRHRRDDKMQQTLKITASIDIIGLNEIVWLASNIKRVDSGESITLFLYNSQGSEIKKIAMQNTVLSADKKECLWYGFTVEGLS